MASLHRDNQFKLRALSSALLACSLSLAASSVFALQEITDEDLGESTGEGIAFLPENAYMLFRGEGANETVATMTNATTGRNNDTGYIRYIPVGPLTNEAANSGAGKADLYLYGLAVSRGDGDLNSRINSAGGTFNNAAIRRWGTPENPWLFKVATETQVPNFNPTTTCSGATDASCQVSYLALEAPMHEFYALNYAGTANDVGNTVPVVTGSSPAADAAAAAAGADAYNLKLAFWADAFVRDPTKPEATGASAATSDQFCLGAASGCVAADSRANRLRLQAVWDGLSLNGSRIQIFQTLSGSFAGAGGNATASTYNGTLGLAGILRFNSGDTRYDATNKTGYGASISSTASISTPAAWSAANITQNGCGNSSIDYGNAACQQRIRTRSVTNTATTTWSLPTGTNVGVLRFSTQECGAGNPSGCGGTAQKKLDSPAVNGVAAPTFDANEGLYLYGANINLVLGSLYQPLVVGKDPNSNNLVLEIAAIPNKAEIYKKIYTDYRTTGKDASYLGSTCSVYACGTAISVNGVKKYQGNSATHSSISIGSTLYDPDTGLLTAYSGVEAIGVSFGALNGTSNTVNTVYSESQNQLRRRRERTYNFGFSSTYDWEYRAANNSYYAHNAGPNNGSAAPAANRDWDIATGMATNPADWRYTTSQVPTAAVNNAPALSPANNLGSAVIDGFLVQHMKITTKGL